MYSINFTWKNTKFYLRLHYNEANNYLFVNGTKIVKFKAKDSEIVPTPLCIGNITKNFLIKARNKNRIEWICLWFEYWLWSYCSWLYIRHWQVFDEKRMNCMKMFRFVKQIFVSAMMVFGCNLSSMNLLECVSKNHQECKVWPKIVNVNSDEPVFFPVSIKTFKCSGSCNNTNNSYEKLCVLDVVKNLNAKDFNLISKANETRHIECNETCKCKCRIDGSICNNTQRWNEDKDRCECK